MVDEISIYDSSLAYQIINYEWDTAIESCRRSPSLARKRGVHGETPLHLAVFSIPHAPMHLIKELLDVYPEATRVQDNDGDLPLHLATGNALPFESFRAIFDCNPEASLVKNCLGQIPLMYSWEIKHIQLMVERFPYIVLFEDLKGQSALTKYFDQLIYAIPCYIVSTEDTFVLKNIIVRRRVASYSVKAETVWRIVCVLLQIVSNLKSCSKICHTILSSWNVEFPLHLLLLSSNCPFRFLNLSIHMFPESVRQIDRQGNYPLHLATQLMSKNKSQWKMRCRSSDRHGGCTWRTGEKEYFDNLEDLIDLLVLKFPAALKIANKDGHIPLQLCSNTPWDAGVKQIVKSYPEGLHVLNLKERIFPFLLQKIGRKNCDQGQCNIIYHFLRGRSNIFVEANIHRLRRSARTRKRKLFSRTTYHTFYS